MELIQATCEQVPPWLDLWLKRKKSLVVITGPVLANNWNWQSMKVNSKNWCQLTDIEKRWQIMKKNLQTLNVINFYWFFLLSWHQFSLVGFQLYQIHIATIQLTKLWMYGLLDTCLHVLTRHMYSQIPVTQTLYNSNLPLTQSNLHFPSDRFLFKPLITQTPGNLNYFLFPLKVQIIGSRLYIILVNVGNFEIL